MLIGLQLAPCGSCISDVILLHSVSREGQSGESILSQSVQICLGNGILDRNRITLQHREISSSGGSSYLTVVNTSHTGKFGPAVCHIIGHKAIKVRRLLDLHEQPIKMQ